ncbi:MAG: hypothetical protein IH948_00755 [Bacteroidetes bacterium]|nr:hypothetical protein [Bacteroidota bacterium]
MKSILSILLAIIFLAGNVGFTVGIHFCGGHAVKTELMFGHNDLSCGMADMDQGCDSHSDTTTLKKKDCCQNQYIQFQIEDDYHMPINEISITDIDLILGYKLAYVSLINTNTSQEVHHIYYPPPVLKRDTYVLFQTFLI